MRHLGYSAAVAVWIFGLACKPAVQLTPPPANATAEAAALAGAKIIIGVGDIASCSSDGDEKTAMIVDSLLRADSVAKVEDAVFTLGDNAYPGGSATDFSLCFTPSWGDSAKGIMKRIHPTPGNHEHETGGAAPYYDYFGKAAGSSKKGYYSYDIGTWHLIALNSEIIVGSFSEADKKAQEDWLQDDLKNNKKLCTIAYFHNPRFSSGWHGSDARLTPLWQVLYTNGVDLVLSGHDHHYERFLPQTPDGVVDSTTGITEMVAGTGGGELRGLRGTMTKNSAFQLQGYFGVLKLTLGGDEYRSAFLDVSGRVWDPHGGKCH